MKPAIEESLPENWAMRKDTIDAAREALEVGLENTQELLLEHDKALGRTTRKNRCTAERLENEICAMQTALEKLRQPDGSFEGGAERPANAPAEWMTAGRKDNQS